MAEKFELVRQSDVTSWGIGAILFGALAIFSTLITGFLPQNLWVGLHANRIEGGNLNQLRAEVTQLRDQQISMRRQTTQLRGRLVVAERGSSNVTQRVGALESAIPTLLEVVPPGADIDRSVFTGSITNNGLEGELINAEGGSVSLIQRPLIDETAVDPNALQALPDALIEPEMATQTSALQPPGSSDIAPVMAEIPFTPTGTATLEQTQFGIALGEPVSLFTANASWDDLSSKVGTLLLGLNPAVSDPLQNGSLRIVAGPISDYSQAEMLCARITRVGIYCLPVQFEEPDFGALL